MKSQFKGGNERHVSIEVFLSQQISNKITLFFNVQNINYSSQSEDKY